MMPISIWPFVWLGVTIVAAIVEGLTTQLTSIWFAIAAVVTAISAFFGLPVSGQLLLFSVTAFALLVGTRPCVTRMLTVKKVPTNADALLGKEALVLPGGQRVSIGGQDWAFRLESGPALSEGERVTVKGIEGVKLVVTRDA